MPAFTFTVALLVFIPAVCLQVVLALHYYIGAVGLLNDQPQDVHRWDAAIGLALHMLAYLLAGPRLLFVLLPWLIKRCLFWCFGRLVQPLWHSMPCQIVRLLGEIINLWLTSCLALYGLAWWPNDAAKLLLLVAVATEVLRLSAQKGQMVLSALWQLLPHRAIAHRLQQQATSDTSWAARYCGYYALSDAERLAIIVAKLQVRSTDLLMQRRMRHFGGFRIVPDSHPLRSGYVRDVARGEVFVHRRWTSDPWLLLGQALRRTPWMFDPRELQRPFAYRTAANRVATAFVLGHARWSPPYAWYQFGHEIKAAGYDLGLRVLKLVGLKCEPPLDVHGCFPFDSRTGNDRRLWCEDEALDDLRQRLTAGEIFTPLAIAEHYTYPLLYIEEVLLPRLDTLHNQHIRYEANAAIIAAAV